MNLNKTIIINIIIIISQGIIKADLDGTTFAYNCRTQLAYNLTYVPFTQLQLLAHDTTKSCTTCSVWILPREHLFK